MNIFKISNVWISSTYLKGKLGKFDRDFYNFRCNQNEIF